MFLAFIVTRSPQTSLSYRVLVIFHRNFQMSEARGKFGDKVLTLKFVVATSNRISNASHAIKARQIAVYPIFSRGKK